MVLMDIYFVPPVVVLSEVKCVFPIKKTGKSSKGEGLL